MFSRVIIFVFVALVSTGFSSRGDDYSEGLWRKTLDNCWTDSSCKRVMTCAHGGEWNVTFPYDSLPAMEMGYADGADAVKGGRLHLVNSSQNFMLIFDERLSSRQR